MWPVVAALGMGAISALNENEKQKDLKRFNEGQAEMTKYSPWTGVRGQIQRYTGPGVLGAGLGGAASGAMLGQQFSGGAPSMDSSTMGMDARNTYQFSGRRNPYGSMA